MQCINTCMLRVSGGKETGEKYSKNYWQFPKLIEKLSSMQLNRLNIWDETSKIHIQTHHNVAGQMLKSGKKQKKTLNTEKKDTLYLKGNPNMIKSWILIRNNWCQKYKLFSAYWIKSSLPRILFPAKLPFKNKNRIYTHMNVVFINRLCKKH